MIDIDKYECLYYSRGTMLHYLKSSLFWFAIFDDKYIDVLDSILIWNIGMKRNMSGFKKLGNGLVSFVCVEVDPEDKVVYFERIKQ